MVRNVDVVEAVGLEAVGLLVWLSAQASPAADLPGGLVVKASVKDLIKILHMGSDKFTRLTSSLQAAGLIFIEQGNRYGQGGGSTSNRYWMTFDPDLPSPRGGRRVFHTPHDGTYPQTQNRDTQFRDVQSRNRHLTPVLEGSSLSVVPETGISAVQVFPDDDIYKISSDSKDKPKTPAFLLQALRDVGWQGASPNADPLLVAVVAKHLKSSGKWTNPAGQLNKLIHQDKLMDYALLHNLISTDPTGALTEYVNTSPNPTMMPYAELCEKQIDFPDWYQVVETEAVRIASMRGESVTMALIREVALTVSPDTLTVLSEHDGTQF